MHLRHRNPNILTGRFGFAFTYQTFDFSKYNYIAIEGNIGAGKTSLAKISKEKVQEIQEEIWAPLNRKAGYSPAWITQTLQGIMIPNFIIYIKKENCLKIFSYLAQLERNQIRFRKD